MAQLRAERAAAGMTQEELAIAAGVSKRALARYLAGERVMSVRIMDDLAVALGLDFRTLFERAEERLSHL